MGTNAELVSAIQLEGYVLCNLISLDFLFKALSSSYGVICSPRMMLRCIPDSIILLAVDLLAS